MQIKHVSISSLYIYIRYIYILHMHVCVQCIHHKNLGHNPPIYLSLKTTQGKDPVT